MLTEKAGCPGNNIARKNPARHDVFHDEGCLSIIVSTGREFFFFFKKK